MNYAASYSRALSEPTAYAKRRRKAEGYDGFVKQLFENPTDLTAAQALQDWFDDNGKPHTADVIRKDIERRAERTPNAVWQVGQNSVNGRREQAGNWNSRFYVYAPQATKVMGGEPYSYTSLSFRHPEDKSRVIHFGFFGSEQEGADKIDGLQAEGHEPYHMQGHRHEEFRAARPELFAKPEAKE